MVNNIKIHSFFVVTVEVENVSCFWEYIQTKQGNHTGKASLRKDTVLFLFYSLIFSFLLRRSSSSLQLLQYLFWFSNSSTSEQGIKSRLLNLERQKLHWNKKRIYFIQQKVICYSKRQYRWRKINKWIYEKCFNNIIGLTNVGTTRI